MKAELDRATSDLHNRWRVWEVDSPVLVSSRFIGMGQGRLEPCY